MVGLNHRDSLQRCTNISEMTTTYRAIPRLRICRVQTADQIPIPQIERVTQIDRRGIAVFVAEGTALCNRWPAKRTRYKVWSERKRAISGVHWRRGSRGANIEIQISITKK